MLLEFSNIYNNNVFMIKSECIDYALLYKGYNLNGVYAISDKEFNTIEDIPFYQIIRFDDAIYYVNLENIVSLYLNDEYIGIIFKNSASINIRVKYRSEYIYLPKALRRHINLKEILK